MDETSNYVRISEILAAEIETLDHGARVESEHELCARFGVSRATVRAALDELESQMLVRRIRGLGTFVNQRLDYVISRKVPPSWSQTILRAGRTPRRVLKDARVIPATTELAEVFGIAEGEPVTEMTTSNYVNDLLSTYGTTWVPCHVAPDLATTIHVFDSTEVLLRESWHLDPVADTCRVSFDLPPAPVRAALELTNRRPAWNVSRSSRDGSAGATIMVSDSWFRPDALRLVVEL